MYEFEVNMKEAADEVVSMTLKMTKDREINSVTNPKTRTRIIKKLLQKVKPNSIAVFSRIN